MKLVIDEHVHLTLARQNVFFPCRFGFKPFLTFASVLVLASMATIAGLVGDKDLSPSTSFDG